MTGSVPARTGYQAGDTVALRGGDWCFEPVRVAASVRERRRGLRPRSAGRGLLVRTRSVHGFGMEEALPLVFVSNEGRVIGSSLLPRNRVMRCRAPWTMELPPGTPLPADGTLLRVVPSSAAWQER